MNKPFEELKTLWYLLFFIWVLPCLGIYLVFVKDVSFAELGPYGDFAAGTLVPFLTFISFLAVVITLRLQRQQLEIQSQELRNSIEEMKATRKEFEIQNTTLTVQRFENTFFQMVSLHNNIVDSLESMGENKKNGRAAFMPMYTALRSRYTSKLKDREFENNEELVRIRKAYVDFFDLYEHQVGHYFRNLYRIVKFIDESEILSFEEKKTYIGVIKAQLSTYELVLLFYNSLSIIGSKFLPLIEEYNLLDNLNENLLINKDTHKEIYRQEASITIK